MSTIQRATHDAENNYFLLSRATAQDRTLSYEARGLLIYLLSKPGDWIVQVKDLMQECGKNRVYKLLKELEAARYLEREFTREKNRVSGIKYVIYETPTLFPQKQEIQKQEIQNSDITEYREEQNTESTEIPLSAKADEPLKQEKSEVSKKPKPRHWTFEVIALECFSLQRDQINGKGGHIGVIVYGSKRGDGELGLLQLMYGKDTKVDDSMDIRAAQELTLMFAWYRRTKPSMSLPSSSGTIWKALDEYRKSGKKSPPDDGIPRDAQGQPLPPAPPQRLPPVTLKEPEYDF